jgi:hypothetical protein
MRDMSVFIINILPPMKLTYIIDFDESPRGKNTLTFNCEISLILHIYLAVYHHHQDAEVVHGDFQLEEYNCERDHGEGEMGHHDSQLHTVCCSDALTGTC